jgi:hypothetical protein
MNPSQTVKFRQFPRREHQMDFNLKRVAEFIRRADTEELLDRVTVYRSGMEPTALDLMEGELDRRGITRDEIAIHNDERLQNAIMLPDGTALRCSFCNRPATGRAWGWHKLYGYWPIFPRIFAYCLLHSKRNQPKKPPDPETNSLG